MNRTIATKMIVMSRELRTLGSMPGATRSEIITRSSSRTAIRHLQSLTGFDELCLKGQARRNSRAEAEREWGREDSNLRRLSRRVYSPFPLAARAHPLDRSRLVALGWCNASTSL